MSAGSVNMNKHIFGGYLQGIYVVSYLHRCRVNKDFLGKSKKHLPYGNLPCCISTFVLECSKIATTMTSHFCDTQKALTPFEIMMLLLNNSTCMPVK